MNLPWGPRIEWEDPGMSLGKPLPRRSRRGHLNTIFTLFLPLVCAVLSCSVRLCEPTRLFCPQGFSRLEYWSGLPCPPPGDLPNPGLPNCRWILYHLIHQGSPWILAWITYPSSRGSSRSRNRTWVSCITGGFFTNWATREAPIFAIFAVTIFFLLWPGRGENSGLRRAVAPEVHSSWSDGLCGIQASEKNWGQSPASTVFIALECVCSSVRGHANPPSFLAAWYWP